MGLQGCNLLLFKLHGVSRAALCKDSLRIAPRAVPCSASMPSWQGRGGIMAAIVFRPTYLPYHGVRQARKHLRRCLLRTIHDILGVVGLLVLYCKPFVGCARGQKK